MEQKRGLHGGINYKKIIKALLLLLNTIINIIRLPVIVPI